MKRFAIFIFSLFAALSFAASCDAASPVRFHVVSVSLTEGAVMVEGHIINEAAAIRVGAAELLVKITDPNGNELLDGTYTFGNMGLTIPANEVEPYTFTLTSEDLAAYNGRFQWRVQSRLKWQEM